MGRGIRSQPTAHGKILARHVGIDDTRFAHKAKGVDRLTKVRGKSDLPSDYVSFKCIHGIHGNCTVLRCTCGCHGNATK